MKRIDTEHLFGLGGCKSCRFGQEHRVGKSRDGVVLHRLKVAVAMGVREASVFGEAFAVVATLVVVEASGIAAVVS